MVMYARKPTRAHKSQPKSQSSSLHRYTKVRDGSSDPIPPYKVLRRSDESPVSRQGDAIGQHGKAKTSFPVRGKNETSGSPQEASHNNSSHQGAETHASQSKPAERDPADDWTEHISSSGKKYYYNCRTEVSQWEKPKDLLEREQRQKDSAKMAANSFPKDMDYRQEALQDKATTSKNQLSNGEFVVLVKCLNSPKWLLRFLFCFSRAEATSADQSTPSNSGHSSSLSSSQNPNSAAGPLGSTPSGMSSSSSAAPPAAQSAQSQSSALLQDPALLHQLLPALQATLQMNNGSMDMAKLNEVLAAAVTQASLRSVLHKLLAAGPAFNVSALIAPVQHPSTVSFLISAQHSSQSPVSVTTDSSSPHPYVSPRNGTPQNSQKPLLGMHIGSVTPSQARVRGFKSRPSLCQTTEKRPEDPRTLQRSSSSGSSQTQSDPPGYFTPTLATHFDETLIRHIQGWPSENTEKQAARLREDFHNMGSLYMSEICTEMKNLRSLVRVCEIQATLREQRVLFLRQQSKELDKLKNQNSYMV
uniref:WW domain containing adaptor with coiled-coil n=1 Tax=Xiphophorus couchianus TaxID=32473 RepID=A0A3B5LNF3_9TELE